LGKLGKGVELRLWLSQIERSCYCGSLLEIGGGDNLASLNAKDEGRRGGGEYIGWLEVGIERGSSSTHFRSVWLCIFQLLLPPTLSN